MVCRVTCLVLVMCYIVIKTITRSEEAKEQMKVLPYVLNVAQLDKEHRKQFKIPGSDVAPSGNTYSSKSSSAALERAHFVNQFPTAFERQPFDVWLHGNLNFHDADSVTLPCTAAVLVETQALGFAANWEISSYIILALFSILNRLLGFQRAVPHPGFATPGVGYSHDDDEVAWERI